MNKIALTMCFLTLLAAPALSATQGKALLIGIENYEKLTTLQYVDNDIRLLSEVLSDRCGFEVTQVIDTAVDEKTRRVGPTTHRDALMKTIESWVDGMNWADTAVLYFSGHGFVGKDGKLYLASLNCDRHDPVPGGVPVAWLRDRLARCPARCKVLLLDACHAGTAKGIDDGEATAKAIEREMRKLSDVVTLASCQGTQNSFLWPGKRQSLFTYWVAEGIKGNSDEDGDGRVGMDELTKYVRRNVERTARKLGHEQNPALLGGDKATRPLSLTPKPITLKRLIMDMAEKIDTQMRQKKLSAVGIPEFASGEQGATLGIKFGTLPAYLANELTDQLAKLADGDYQVVSGKSLHEELRRRKVNITNLETSHADDLKVGGIDVPALAIGRIRGREGIACRLGCKLKKSGSAAQLGSANGVCFLNSSEWAMLGRSGAASNASVPGGNNPLTVMAERIETLDAQAAKPHPMLDPRFPFAVEVQVKEADGKYTLREGKVKGNDYFVPLRRGDVYRIVIYNRTPRGAFMRLLVDGLNTLPERLDTHEKGFVVEPTNNEGQWTVAPRVNLAEARAWYLDPAKRGEDGTLKLGRYGINGFYKKSGDYDAYREFVVTDAPESAAARQGFSEQIGLITAAFYRPTSPRALGTKLGKEYHRQLETYAGGMVPGELIGVLQVRYDKP